jgi:hypothetical protein
MSTYLQMGHESWSLLGEEDGGDYAGIVLSPVNDGPEYVADRLARLGEARDELEVILDPQLYNPAAERGKLSEWSYYTAEFETADHHDEGWWVARGGEVAENAARLGVEAMCSPALYPREFSDDYYRFVVDVADETSRRAAGMGVETLLTAIVNLRELANPRRALEIASILTETDCERVYLTFLSDDVQQREPLKDAAGLATAVHLVRLLSASQRVHVAFCAHDVLLWKASGATDASTGKWMNVRRFSPGRWREEDGMGRQVPYWCEGSLLTLLRDQDVLRLDREGWFADRRFRRNPSSARILEILRSGSGAAWQKLSWLQYLRWFSNVEAKWGDAALAEKALEASDAKWAEVDDKRIKMTDRFNDGTHVRAWLNALSEGGRR